LLTEEAVTLVETDVEATIVAHLVREPRVVATSTGPSGVTSSTVSGGPGADPATIVFQKTRTLATCRMHSVAFTNQQGLAVEWVIRTWQKSDGSWVVAPVGGGGHAPMRTKPWLNLAAQWGPDHFAAGGHVEGTGSELAVKVRLVFADGFTLEDNVDAGIVLFFEPRSLAFPADVVILDEHGGLLTKYKEFDRGPFVR
jgi:sugar (pentulose or hexulose) kinase